MSWATQVTLDRDKTDVASVSATFTDADSTTFTHSARVEITSASRDAFIAEAIALRDDWQQRKSNEAGYETNVNNRFVELDV